MLYRPPAARLGGTQFSRHALVFLVLYDLGRQMAEWWRIRRAAQHLASLDDRLLADIEVERS